MGPVSWKITGSNPMPRNGKARYFFGLWDIPLFPLRQVTFLFSFCLAFLVLGISQDLKTHKRRHSCHHCSVLPRLLIFYESDAAFFYFFFFLTHSPSRFEFLALQGTRLETVHLDRNYYYLYPSCACGAYMLPEDTIKK